MSKFDRISVIKGVIKNVRRYRRDLEQKIYHVNRVIQTMSVAGDNLKMDTSNRYINHINDI